MERTAQAVFEVPEELEQAQLVRRTTAHVVRAAADVVGALDATFSMRRNRGDAVGAVGKLPRAKLTL
jgi:hypothetical protein